MLTVVIFGAIFGAAGAVLGSLLARLFKLTGLPARALAALVFAIFIALSQPARQFFQNQGHPRGPSRAEQVQASFLQLPAYAAMKTYYPETFAKVADAVDKAMRSNVTDIEAMSAGRVIYADLISKTSRLADDANTLALITLARDQGKAAAAVSTDACYQLLAGKGQLDFDPTKVLPKALGDREADLAVALFKQTATAPQPAHPNAAAIKADLESVQQAVTAGMSDADRESVVKSSDPAMAKSMTHDDRAAACRFNIRTMDELLKLPPARGAALYKSFMDA